MLPDDEQFLQAPALDDLLSYGFEDDAFDASVAIWRKYCNAIVGQESSSAIFGMQKARELVVTLTNALRGGLPHVRASLIHAEVTHSRSSPSLDHCLPTRSQQWPLLLIRTSSKRPSSTLNLLSLATTRSLSVLLCSLS